MGCVVFLCSPKQEMWICIKPTSELVLGDPQRSVLLHPRQEGRRRNNHVDFRVLFCLLCMLDICCLAFYLLNFFCVTLHFFFYPCLGLAAHRAAQNVPKDPFDWKQGPSEGCLLSVSALSSNERELARHVGPNTPGTAWGCLTAPDPFQSNCPPSCWTTRWTSLFLR